MVGAVQGRPDQIVHGGIHDQEGLVGIRLLVENLRQEDPGVADDRAARLEDQHAFEVLEERRDRLRKILGLRRDFILIGDPEPPADVQIADLHPDAFELLHKVENLLQRLDIGADVHQLRADVLVHADDFDVLESCGEPELIDRPFRADPKLAFLQPRADIGVGFGIDVRIDSQRDASMCFKFTRDTINGEKLRRGFHIEHENIGVQRIADLFIGFSNTGEHDPLGHKPGL